MFRECQIFHGVAEDGKGFMCTLVKPPLQVVYFKVAESGKWIITNVSLMEGPLRILNVYVSNELKE